MILIVNKRVVIDNQNLGHSAKGAIMIKNSYQRVKESEIA